MTNTTPAPRTLPADFDAFYRGTPVLVTGGLGFIGSNVVRRLVFHGARVTVLDSMNDGQGGNYANLADIDTAVELVIADQADPGVVAELVTARTVIFNIAGRGAHADSLRDPAADMHSNVTAQIALLEAVRQRNPAARVVYAGTRSQYGRSQYLPVDENHPQLPSDVNGVHKAAGERLHMVYGTCHGLRTCSLRLTNIYGPRQLMAHGRQGFANWFMRRALDAEEILVYGDGSQLRDLLYVDDAVEAFLIAGMQPAAEGLAFNIASGEGFGVRAIAEATVAAAGNGTVRAVEYPSDHRPIEVGDFVADITAARIVLGWQPSVSLEDGLARTAAYFATRRDDYWGNG
jgi:UDP-glucose 4-epimerase